jgi:hypothetical protein
MIHLLAYNVYGVSSNNITDVCKRSPVMPYSVSAGSVERVLIAAKCALSLLLLNTRVKPAEGKQACQNYCC